MTTSMTAAGDSSADLFGLGEVFEAEGWEGHIDDGDETEGDNVALRRLTQRITGQHADVFIRFASTAYEQSDVRSLVPSLRSTTRNLLRLAESSEQDDQIALFREFDAIVAMLGEATGRSRSRQSALIRLRKWLTVFAQSLLPDDAERVRSIIDVPRLPMVNELKSVRGIGRKRLGRLYAAGLHEIGTVVHALPSDIADVTGIPESVAERVVTASRRFAERERSRAVDNMAEGARRLDALVQAVELSNDESLVQAAREAIRQLELTLERMEKKR